MLRFCFSYMAIVATIFFLHNPVAIAAEPSCGVSTYDAIAAAQKALAEKSDKSQALALACLLEAVKDMNTPSSDVVRGEVPSPPVFVTYMNALVDTLAEDDATFSDRLSKKLKAGKP
jgi:hypothetical protein